MSSKKSFRADYPQTKSLVKAARNAARNAVRHSSALELPVSYIDKGVVYKRLPDGTIKRLGQVEVTASLPFTLVKGMILHGKK